MNRNGYECEGTVEEIDYYTRATAPYPVEKTKDKTGKIFNIIFFKIKKDKFNLVFSYT